MSREARLRRISTLSRRLRWAFYTVIVVSLGALTLGYASPDRMDLTITSVEFVNEDAAAPARECAVEAPAEHLTAGEKRILLLMIVSYLLLYAAPLYQFDRLLRLYQRGSFLARASAIRLERAGWLLVVAALAAPLLGAGLVVAFVVPIAQRLATDTGFAIGTVHLWEGPDFGALCLGFGVLLVGHVMRVACEVSEDAELTV